MSVCLYICLHTTCVTGVCVCGSQKMESGCPGTRASNGVELPQDLGNKLGQELLSRHSSLKRHFPEAPYNDAVPHPTQASQTLLRSAHSLPQRYRPSGLLTTACALTEGRTLVQNVSMLSQSPTAQHTEGASEGSQEFKEPGLSPQQQKTLKLKASPDL